MSNAQNLIRSNEKGLLTGISNMLSKENSEWWNIRSLLMQAVIWFMLINAFVAFALFIIPTLGEPSDNIKKEISDRGAVLADRNLEYFVTTAVNIFFNVSGWAIIIGAIIIGHESIFKEKETGTAAWVLSKPLSRTAFIMSKFLSNWAGMLLIVVLFQGIIAYALCCIKLGSLMAIAPFFEGLAVLGLNVTFYMTLAIALGAFMNSRSGIIGIPILVAVAGSIIPQFIPETAYFMPWALNQVSTALATGFPIPATAALPVIATVIWIIVMVGATLWKFNRAEL